MSAEETAVPSATVTLLSAASVSTVEMRTATCSPEKRAIASTVREGANAPTPPTDERRRRSSSPKPKVEITCRSHRLVPS